MVVQEDTVFVSGMDENLTEEDIAQHFGAIGVIKVGYSHTPRLLARTKSKKVSVSVLSNPENIKLGVKIRICCSDFDYCD